MNCNDFFTLTSFFQMDWHMNGRQCTGSVHFSIDFLVHHFYGFISFSKFFDLQTHIESFCIPAGGKRWVKDYAHVHDGFHGAFAAFGGTLVERFPRHGLRSHSH